MFVVNVAALKELPKICETVAKMSQQLWSCPVAMISQIMLQDGYMDQDICRVQYLYGKSVV